MDLRYAFRNIRNIFTEKSDENYEISRRRFIFEGCTSNAIFTLTSGAFLVGYAKYLGASDQFNGIILSIPLITYILQLFSPLFLERLTSRKKLIVVCCVMYRTILGLMILIPVITDNKQGRLLLLAVMYFAAYLLFSFANPAIASWLISLVPEKTRGRYFGFRDMCILAFCAVLSLVLGRILDTFRTNSHEYMGFVVVFSVILILVAVNFLLIRGINEPKVIPLKQSLNFKSLFTMPLTHKGFRKVILLNIIWNLSIQLALPFFSVYMVTGLELSYTFIMAMGILTSFVQAFSAKIWGKVADKLGWEFTIVLSIFMVGTCNLIWMFINKKTCYILIPVVQVIAGAAWAGANLSFFNIQFKYAPQEGQTVFIGFNAASAGIAGFLSASVGATLVGALSGMKIDIGITVLNNMLFIFGLSGVLVVLCAIFTAYLFKVKKPKLN